MADIVLPAVLLAAPVITLIIGVLVLFFPKMLRLLVGFYLVLVGLLGVLAII